ncbi:AAA family ATPase [Saccharopolyspora sp. 6M]|uniref:AAA family ATPase n=1 Tax=Saccharopolyspora sp. 6M TaxID=2877237 RepID=UPI001CD65A09|nr:AAA family ATPase [Saccharopolyspora sp. 6M]MCA1229717.1 AAA family ATPase [Saccharopolyspora sp. 6M]
MGTAQTRLLVLRGNSGSGKTTVARALREQCGAALALVEQDYLRRTVLKARDTADGPHYGLIEQTVRYALNVGYDVVLEGILHRERYHDLLTRLARDHLGPTRVYYFDVSWEETLRRHAGRPQAAAFGVEEMRRWWCPHDVLGWPGEQLVPESATVAETTGRLLAALHQDAPSTRLRRQ